MNVRRYSIVAGACAAALMSGCAQLTPKAEAPPLKVSPVYRVQQPAGTAAGQYAVGRIDLSEGRIEAAIVRFRNSLKLDPNFVEAHNGLGVAFGMQGRYAESAEAFRAALALGPASAHVLNNLGFAQMRGGNLIEARQSFARSLELDPKNASTRENVRRLADLQRGQPRASVDTAAVPKAVSEPSRVDSPERVIAQSAPAEAALSASDDTVLVRLSTNIYELRRGDRSASVGAVPSASVAVAAAAASSTAVVAPPTAPAPSRAARVSDRSTAQRSAVVSVSRFEVSNGAGVERLAARTATQFARLGIGISRVSNYESFDRVSTEIHYRKGYLEHARRVQKSLPVQAKLVASSRLRSDVNVRLVVGRDMVQPRIAGWYESGNVQAAATPSGEADKRVEQMSVPDGERVVARANVAGWRYL